MLTMAAQVDDVHRLPSAGNEMPKAVAAHSPLAVTVRDVARARWDAPTVFVEPDWGHSLGERIAATIF